MRVRSQMFFRSIWVVVFIAVLAVMSYVSMYKLDQITNAVNTLLLVTTKLNDSQQAIERYFVYGDSAVYASASQSLDSAISMSRESLHVLVEYGVRDSIIDSVRALLAGVRSDYDTVYLLRGQIDIERAQSDTLLQALKRCVQRESSLRARLLLAETELGYQQAERSWTRQDFDTTLMALRRVEAELESTNGACLSQLRSLAHHCSELGRASVQHVNYEVSSRQKSSRAAVGLLATADAARQLSHRMAIRSNRLLVGIVSVITLLSLLLMWLQAASFSKALLKVRGQLRGVAGGDLVYEEPGSAAVSLRVDEFGDVMRGMQIMQERLKEMMLRVHESAVQMDGSSKMVYNHADELRKQAIVQAVQAEQSVNSMSVVSEKINRNTGYAQESKQIAFDNRKAMEAFSESTAASDRALQEIAQMMDVINGVARQTNILALNAAVEAARAGDAGRGFAVVAGEVRKLAERSSAAAKQVGMLVEKAGRASGKLALEMEKVMPKIAESVELAERVVAVGEDQLAEVQKIEKQVSLLSEQSQTNSDMSYKLVEQSETLAHASANVLEALGQFKFKG